MATFFWCPRVLFATIVCMIFFFVCLLVLVSIGVGIWLLPKSSIANPVPVGSVGFAVETFAREGFVLVRGELWRAHIREGVVEKGDTVIVVGYCGGLSIEVVRKG
jgi:membrane-bound ClpP family serine protease